MSQVPRNDGNEIIKPVTVDADIPDFSEFVGPDNFLEVFDAYGKVMLKDWNKAAEEATEGYLAESSPNHFVACCKH